MSSLSCLRDSKDSIVCDWCFSALFGVFGDCSVRMKIDEKPIRGAFSSEGSLDETQEDEERTFSDSELENVHQTHVSIVRFTDKRTTSIYFLPI